jgi:hypothetical protein
MSNSQKPNPPSRGQFLVYQTDGGQLKIDVRLEGETAWLTQAHMAELFQTTVPNVSMHLRNVYAEGELQAAATIKEFLIVRQEGNRQVSRAVEYYNLDAIISVGCNRIHHKQIEQADQAGGDFDKAIKQLPPPPKRKRGGRK